MPDLLVAGGGVAGMAAAARAAARGARVLVVEKGERLGGSGALSPGVLWTVPDLHSFAEVCPRGDRELGRVLVEGFNSAVELARDAGVEVSDGWDDHFGFGRAVRVDVLGLIARWEEDVLAAGGQVRRRSAVRELTLDGVGAVRGAVVDAEEIEAEAVLLATGGFQGDRRSVRRFLGPGAELMLVRANPHSTGDGMRMGSAVGASLAGPMDGFHGHLVPSPLTRFGPAEFVPLTQYHSRHCLLVNQEGRRFTCEKWGDEVSNLALLRQPGMRAILLCDERVRREHVGDAFELARSAGAHLIKADTLERLADFAERDLLESRLHEAPFWALEVQPTITFTYGGLRTDADGRVRDEYGRPIPGLFAAGVDVGGLHDTGYLGGLALGLVFGPRAADAALRKQPARPAAPRWTVERGATHARS
jgi:succinate dehydrogenase/fumarate reductase flavoprotein subunit